MTTDRPYRAARPTHEAVEELRRCAGTDFDPQTVEALGTGRRARRLSLRNRRARENAPVGHRRHA